MSKFRFSGLLVALILLGTPAAASAQSVVYYESAPGTYQNAPTHRFPRLYRTLEVLSEPAVLMNPMPYPGYVPTQHPFLDAAPNVANLVFLGLTAVNSPALNWIGTVVPVAIRLVRVALYGMPFPATRGETVLWLFSPRAVQIRRTYQATGHLFNPPLLSQPLFPRLHARRHGYQCECR